MRKVWCLAPDQWDHLRPIETEMDAEAEFIYDPACDPARMLEGRPDIVLCVNEFRLAVADCLYAARRAGIPSLLVQDGILEWRCQYENPLFGAGGGPPQHQPVLCDRIACIGQQSARVIRSWGNAEKVEVVGMPRLDHLLRRPKVDRCLPGRRVLVATSKNPGFTPEQREITRRSLVDVASELNALPDVQVTWRVSPSMARELGVSNSLAEFSSYDFASTLEHSDALITTPSTSMLEAMLLDRPVAALDYHNVPRFVPTVWSITSREQIRPALTDMLRCPENKMQYQGCLLADYLACDGPAAPRVADLIRRMITAARHASWNGADTNSDTTNEEHKRQRQPANTLPLSSLYPDQAIFQIHDLNVLYAHVARLQKENKRLKQDLTARSLTNGLYKVGRLLSARLSGHS
ncbi:MAG: hypothetical protein JO108_30720 [Acidobacteriaceae bacterium]|nr:hypothetical protein [Acidobacteriaceae bacterium]